MERTNERTTNQQAEFEKEHIHEALKRQEEKTAFRKKSKQESEELKAELLDKRDLVSARRCRCCCCCIVVVFRVFFGLCVVVRLVLFSGAGAGAAAAAAAGVAAVYER